MDIALVGSSGVLGRNLAPLLLERGYGVRALVRSVEKARAVFPPEIDVRQLDLLADDAPGRLPGLLEGCQAVAHIATAIPVGVSAVEAAQKWATNTRLRTFGTRRLLDAALAAGVETYLQQSITMAYPDSKDEWITEDMALDTSPGRVSITAPVIEMESMLRGLSPGRLRWIILRGGNFVGKDTGQELAIRELRAGERRVACDGRNYVSLIHVADMAAAFADALLSAPGGAIYNVVDEPIREGEYLDNLAAAIGAPTPARDAQLACPPSWRCSSTRAKTDLHWAPAHMIIPA
jgi:nucleoside-diphosphate-sugar epimerase